MDKSNRLDFTGQPIYIGLDVQKKSWSVSIHSAACEHKTFAQPPEVDILVNYLRRNFPGRRTGRFMKRATVDSGLTIS